MKLLLFFILTSFGTIVFGQLQEVNVYFDKLSSTLRPEGEIKLTALKELLNNDSTKIQSISAYSDTLGTVELNKRLATERYSNVLKALGIKTNEANFEVNIYGEEFPFVASEYNIEQFRRVTIVHYVKEPPVIEEIIEEVVEEVIIEEVVEEVVEETPTKLITQLSEFAEDSDKKEILLQLSILFIGDKDIVMKESESELEELYNFLNEHKNITAHIRGHVCCKPNAKLSKQRAARVYEYLIEKSIEKDRLSYKGYSNEVPFVTPELTPEDRQANRRVDIIFKKP